jgi:ATF/CREB family transcription factor
MLIIGQNVSPPRESQSNDMDTPSTYLLSDKFLAAEHNPFEQSFAIRPNSSGNGTDTPKPALPGVLEMFTPGGTNQYEQFNFAESLRHGPLSPNLLAGPQNPLPFDPGAFRTGLTPNESNIRTGLTPGNTPGFPMLPTPGTAALLGPYTPNTTAALASMQSTTYPVPTFTGPPRPIDQFGENQAANGLVFLAQTSQQQAAQSIPSNPSTREELVKRAAANNSKVNAYQDPSTLMNNSKKSEDSKTTRSKKIKAEEPIPNGKDTKKSKSSKHSETDDEKRRNFLERNRQGTASPLPSNPPLFCTFCCSC